jgi:hypothetical protein
MMIRTLQKSNSKSRILPALTIILALLLSIFSSLEANKSPLLLEKTQEFLVRDFSSFPIARGFSTWTPTKSGYMLGTAKRLYFYSPSLELTHSFEISGLEGGNLFVDDTVIYQLDPTKWAVTQYDLEGNLLRRWVYPSYHFIFRYLTVLQGKIVIAGKTWGHIEAYNYKDAYPVIRIYDTLTYEPPVEIDRFITQERLDYINDEKKAGDFLSTHLTPFEDGFIAVNAAEPYVFFFTSSGKLQWKIDDIPQGYKGITEAPAWSMDNYKKNPSYTKDWFSQWDYTEAGITIIQDSLLIVPRNTSNHPVSLDIYNLVERRFLTRLEAPGHVAGASHDQLFFIDTIAKHFAQISAYRLVPGKDTIVISDTATIARLLKPKEKESEEVCSGESGCCSPPDPFGHVQCAPEKLDVIDTIPAGKERIARVVCNYALAPDSLFQFCHPKKKTMFIFVAPTSEISNKLLDTLSYHLKGKKDWVLITVVGYPAPPDLSFYLTDLKGDQILINRCVSIPDATLALSDIPQPPIAFAFSEGGKELIGGYSLSPSFDAVKQEKKVGIIFAEFLRECGIAEE